MDMKLDRNRGDHYRDSRGLTVNISGLEELLQRAYMAVSVPMGSLPGSRNFGGDRILVEKAAELGKAEEGLFAMAENALSGEAFRRDGLRVKAVSISADGTWGRVDVSSYLGDGSFEVKI